MARALRHARRWRRCRLLRAWRESKCRHLRPSVQGGVAEALVLVCVHIARDSIEATPTDSLTRDIAQDADS